MGLVSQIERVFGAASHKKVWDHFTKAQRKNIDMWKRQSLVCTQKHQRFSVVLFFMRFVFHSSSLAFVVFHGICYPIHFYFLFLSFISSHAHSHRFM